MEILILCPRGLEEILSQEIGKLISNSVILGKCYLKVFNCSFEDIYKINLYSRLASRVLLKLTSAKVNNIADVYNISFNIKWHEYFNVDNTIKVKVTGQTPWCKNIDFLALKIKDAVCDNFRHIYNQRPSVDKIDPKIRISAYIDENTLDLYIDTSGESLFKRMWRKNTGIAPIRENLAAGLLLISGFNGGCDFFDPMCGSGTLVIEAALIAINQAPGLLRNFAFENFIGFDGYKWNKIKQQAKQQVNKNIKIKLYASDISKKIIFIAKENAENAGVLDVIDFNNINFLNAKSPSYEGMIITNPAYGKRLSDLDNMRKQYYLWSKVLKEFYYNWQISFITSDLEFCKYLKLKPKRKSIIYNGKIECRLYIFDIVKGSNR